MKRAVLFMFIAALLSSCAAPIKFVGKDKFVNNPPFVEDNNFGTVNIVRSSVDKSCTIQSSIELNDSKIYYMDCGEYISFRVPVAQPFTVTANPGVMPNFQTIIPETGKRYYFEVKCRNLACSLQEIGEKSFRETSNSYTEVKIGY
ncbi:MAG: hypothetical protein FWD70_05405 [Desulfuromonadales bacterium]|nr:hypothetical protein [Desulfuromonadales bacterium]